MHVIATAGHVDHGKSTLVRSLTGSDPDRLEEERARGLSIELGYAWTQLPPVGDVAFVDVPGHERFVSTMLAGIGPVPAVLMVVAADDPWMPQAAEHLAALDALGVEHGVVAVTRSDLADPAPMVARAADELSVTSLAGASVVSVSAATGAGLDELRSRLVSMVAAVPDPDAGADVRLWVDRCFHIRGAGTVVTGTLPQGRISRGDTLMAGGRALRVRAVESLGRQEQTVAGVARVAVNLAGADKAELDRHSVLTTPGAWRPTTTVDVAIRIPYGAGDRDHGEVPRRPQLHVGAAAVPVHYRPLAGTLGRISFDDPLPLRIGDRALLRDPGSRRLWGVTVLDPAPAPLRRRGAARDRASQLLGRPDPPSVAEEIQRRGLVELAMLEKIGVPVDDHDRALATVGGWCLSDARKAELRHRLNELVAGQERENPLAPGMALSSVTARLGLPSPELTAALVESPLELHRGLVRARRTATTSSLSPQLLQGVEAIGEDLRREPFSAPTAGRLLEVGLTARAVAAAAKEGRLLHLGDGIVLLPGADEAAVGLLAELPQPFTTSEARSRLGTTRRVALPLLAHLDRRGSTRRLPDDRRIVVAGRQAERTRRDSNPKPSDP